MATLAAPFDVPQKVGNEIRILCAAVKIYRGSAVAVVSGTGYATPLVPATDGHRFKGVALSTVDNSGGSAGDKAIVIARTGLFAFNQSGLTQADVGKKCWFSDDNTVTTTPGQVLAGVIETIDTAPTAMAWVRIDESVSTGNPTIPVAISADGAIAPRTSGAYVVTKAGVCAMTLAAPTATTDDGVEIWVTSNTANAHTLTATGLLQCGTAAVNLATFAAQKGAGVCLVAYQGKWNVKYSVGITFS